VTSSRSWGRALGEDDASEFARRPRPPDVRHDRRFRGRGDGDVGRQADRLAGRHVGFIFQMYNLIPVLTGVPERRAPAPPHEALEGGATDARRDGPLRRRARRPNEALPSPALRRTGAAGRHRPGDRRRPDVSSLRRADRGSRPEERRRDHADHRSARPRAREDRLMVTHDPKAAEVAHVILHLEKGVLVEAAGGGGNHEVPSADPR